MQRNCDVDEALAGQRIRGVVALHLTVLRLDDNEAAFARLDARVLLRFRPHKIDNARRIFTLELVDLIVERVVVEEARESRERPSKDEARGLKGDKWQHAAVDDGANDFIRRVAQNDVQLVVIERGF